MDQLNQYRQIVERLLLELAARRPANPSLAYKTIFDRQANSYALVSIGWHGPRRIHHFVIHAVIARGAFSR